MRAAAAILCAVVLLSAWLLSRGNEAVASQAVTGSGLGMGPGGVTTQPATINVAIFVGQSNGAGAYGLEGGIEQDASGSFCGGTCANLQTWDNAAVYNGDANTYTLNKLWAPIHANFYDGGMAGIDPTTYGSASCADYPANICGETAAERAVNEATLLFRGQGYPSFRWGVINTSRNGAFLDQINVGTQNYNRMLSEVVAYRQAAAAGVPSLGIPPGSSVLVSAIVMMNGEADCSTFVFGTSYGNRFATALQLYQSNAEADIKVANGGQTRAIPLLLVQQNGACLSTQDYSSHQQIVASQTSSAGKVLFIGSREADSISTISGSAGLHQSTLGYEQIGEHAIGKYLWRVENYLEGNAPWPVTAFAPVKVASGALNPGNPDPGTFTRVSGNTFNVRVTVPMGPVAIQAGFPLPHQSGALAAAFSTCAGWEGWLNEKSNDGGLPQHDGSPVTCNSVTVIDNPSGTNVIATFQVAFASAITGIAYAQSADSAAGKTGAADGRVGPWGDSDCTATISGNCNRNQLATFYQGGMDTL